MGMISAKYLKDMHEKMFQICHSINFYLKSEMFPSLVMYVILESFCFIYHYKIQCQTVYTLGVLVSAS